MKSLLKLFMLLTLPLICHGMEQAPLTLDTLPQDYITGITQQLIKIVGTPAIQNRADMLVTIKYIKWLSYTNKTLYYLVNSQPVTSAMITALANRFNIDRADAALELLTPGAGKWVSTNRPVQYKKFQQRQSDIAQDNAHRAQTMLELKESPVIDQYPLAHLSELPQWAVRYTEQFKIQPSQSPVVTNSIVEPSIFWHHTRTLTIDNRNDALIVSLLMFLTKRFPHRTTENSYDYRSEFINGSVTLKYQDPHVLTVLTHPAIYQRIVFSLTVGWHKASLTDLPPYAAYIHHKKYSEEEWILLTKRTDNVYGTLQPYLIELLAKKIGLLGNAFSIFDKIGIGTMDILDGTTPHLYLYLWIKKSAYDEVVDKLQLKIEEERLPIQDSENDLFTTLAPYNEQMINNFLNLVHNNSSNNNQDDENEL